MFMAKQNTLEHWVYGNTTRLSPISYLSLSGPTMDFPSQTKPPLSSSPAEIYGIVTSVATRIRFPQNTYMFAVYHTSIRPGTVHCLSSVVVLPG